MGRILVAEVLDEVETAVEDRVSLEQMTVRILGDILERKKVPKGLNLESLYALLGEKREDEAYDLLKAWTKGEEFKGDLKSFMEEDQNDK